MAISIIPSKCFASVKYDIPNDSNRHNYNYPNGYTGSKCALLSAKCYTKYSSWVDSAYNGGNYFGDLLFDEDSFGFAARTAGNTTKIIFTFAKIG